jgi:ribosomal protein S25
MTENESAKKFVYLLECGDKFYKIGVATSMNKRLGSIKVGNPFPIYIVTRNIVENAHKLEKEIHHRLKKRQVSGEWFKLEPAEVIEVCTLINSKTKQKKFYNGKTILSFGDKKIIDSSRKLWTIQRQELFDKPVEAIQLTKSDNKKEINKNKETDFDIISEAELLIKKYGIASSSFLQRKMKIGYSRAARIMDILEEKGIVSHADGSKARKILS